MDTKEKAFIIGAVFLFLALLSITVFPVLVQKFTHCDISPYVYAQIEFYLLFMCAGLYVYSSKYYGYQLYSVLCATVFYIAFAWFLN